MSAAGSIVQALRSALRQRGMTYRQLARAIKVSEPTVKRDFSRGNFSLNRLDRICDALQLSLADLVESTAGAMPLLSCLTDAQERALVRNPELLVVTYLVVNDWKWNDITATFQLDDNRLISVLLRLDEIGIVQYRPPRRIRKLTARNFSWRKDGPIHGFFLNRVAPEFLRSAFDAPSDELRFIGGLLSPSSLAQMKASVERLALEFDELSRRDARLSIDQKNGCSMLLAMRQWEFSEFTRLRRAR
jgi:transcriptional regulator with XRE-family HTH domain